MADRDTQIVRAALQQAALEVLEWQAFTKYAQEPIAKEMADAVLEIANDPAEVAAILATVPEVEVKPLVFSQRPDLPDGAHLAADTAFGRYYIANRGEYGFGWKRPGHYAFMGFERTEELAEIATQADYARRVRECLR